MGRKPRRPIGVFVPPPSAQSVQVRPLDERIARVRSRAAPKAFLDAEPVTAPVSLDDMLRRRTADWNRRTEQHLRFLEEDRSFYEIRAYIQDEPFRCVGEWVEGFTSDDGEFMPSAWSWTAISDWQAAGPNFHAAIEEVRAHLIDVFREVLGDSVCVHGQQWEDWKPRNSWDKSGAAGCGRCFLDHELKRRELDSRLADFPDAKNVAHGNTKSANKVLFVLGQDVHQGTLRESITASPEKIEQILGQQQKELGKESEDPPLLEDPDDEDL
jgi:hypothetical protein